MSEEDYTWFKVYSLSILDSNRDMSLFKCFWEGRKFRLSNKSASVMQSPSSFQIIENATNIAFMESYLKHGPWNCLETDW